MSEKSKRKLISCPELLEITADLIELIELYEQKAAGVIAKSVTFLIPYRIRDFVVTTGKRNIKEVRTTDFDKFKTEKIKKGWVNISINSYFTSFEHFWNLFGINLHLQRLAIESKKNAS